MKKRYLKYSKPLLINIILRREEEIKELKESIKYETYKKLADQLQEERKLNEPLIKGNRALAKRLKQYQLLVGDIDIVEFYTVDKDCMV